MEVPTLVELCVQQVAGNVLYHASNLHALSLELGELLVQKVPRLDVGALRAFGWAFWRPAALSLTREPTLSSGSLRHLNLFATCLLKLDLSGCSWLDNLEGLQGITGLECLNVRDCVNLGADTLAQIQVLPNLRCLDMENVASISDTQAAHFIPGMRTLQALNLSGTPVTNKTIEAVTYGVRLRKWNKEEQAARAAALAAEKEDLLVPYWERDPQNQRKRQRAALARASSSSSSAFASSQECSLWPITNLVFLRLQNTLVTADVVEHLSCMEDLQLVDLRHTKVTVPKVEPLQGRFRLTRLPNEAKLLSRSNGVLIATIKGACGCAALGWERGNTPETMESVRVDKVKPEWVRTWEFRGTVQLLQKAAEDDLRAYERNVAQKRTRLA